jgi:hypothetical protein
MKDLKSGFTTTYTWALSFNREENTLGLYHKKDAAVIAEIFICNRWVEFILFHLPGGYWLWDKVVLWSSSKEERILTLPATEEMLKTLAPEEEWLWNKDYVEEED